MGREYLMGAGVPEPPSSPRRRAATPRNRRAALAVIARANGLHRLVIVSDGTHMFRIHAICAADGLDVLTSPRPRTAAEDSFAGQRRDAPRDSDLHAVAAAPGLRRADREQCGMGDSEAPIADARVRKRQNCQQAKRKAAALAVDRKFTASLLSQPRRSSVAPSRLSKNRPKTAARPADAEKMTDRRAKPGSRRTDTTPAAITPASVPARVMPPSVPGSTRRRVVIMRGWPPSTWPISEDTVSAAASARAANPRAKMSIGAEAGGENTCESISRDCIDRLQSRGRPCRGWRPPARRRGHGASPRCRGVLCGAARSG